MRLSGWVVVPFFGNGCAAPPGLWGGRGGCHRSLKAPAGGVSPLRGWDANTTCFLMGKNGMVTDLPFVIGAVGAETEQAVADGRIGGRMSFSQVPCRNDACECCRRFADFLG